MMMTNDVKQATVKCELMSINDEHPDLALYEMKILKAGVWNNIKFSKKAIMKSIEKWSGKAVLWSSKTGNHTYSTKIDKDTGEAYESFTEADAEKICGIIPFSDSAKLQEIFKGKNLTTRIENIDGAEYLVAPVIVWKFYNQELVKEMGAQGEKPVSAELYAKRNNIKKLSDGVVEFLEIEPLGVTILTTTALPNIQPAVEGANIKTLSKNATSVNDMAQNLLNYCLMPKGERKEFLSKLEKGESHNMQKDGANPKEGIPAIEVTLNNSEEAEATKKELEEAKAKLEAETKEKAELAKKVEEAEKKIEEIRRKGIKTVLENAHKECLEFKPAEQVEDAELSKLIEKASKGEFKSNEEAENAYAKLALDKIKAFRKEQSQKVNDAMFESFSGAPNDTQTDDLLGQ